MSANEIGFFQLNNLIKNRIPFSLVTIEVNLTEHYSGIEKNHIEQNQIAFENASFNSESIDKAIVFICMDGQKSYQAAAELESKGFKNVFMVTGGLQQLLQEKNF
jgi:rhodanese-related sulfurtransferase